MKLHERLAAALRAQDEDHFIENGRVIVCGWKPSGALVEFGSLDLVAFCQKGAPPLRQGIDRILFARMPEKGPEK